MTQGSSHFSLSCHNCYVLVIGTHGRSPVANQRQMGKLHTSMEEDVLSNIRRSTSPICCRILSGTCTFIVVRIESSADDVYFRFGHWMQNNAAHECRSKLRMARGTNTGPGIPESYRLLAQTQPNLLNPGLPWIPVRHHYCPLQDFPLQ